MKKYLFLIVFLASYSTYAQVSIVTGYDYIGRNTFHVGLAGNISFTDTSKHDYDLGMFLTTGVHLTGYNKDTHGIFEATAALSYNWLFAGATYTPYSVIPKIGFGRSDLYVYVGYAIPTSDTPMLNKGISVGVNIDPLYLIALPFAILIGDPLR